MLKLYKILYFLINPEGVKSAKPREFRRNGAGGRGNGIVVVKVVAWLTVNASLAFPSRMNAR